MAGRFLALLGSWLLVLWAAATVAAPTQPVDRDTLAGLFRRAIMDCGPPPGVAVEVRDLVVQPASLPLPPGILSYRFLDRPADAGPGWRQAVVAVAVDGRRAGVVRVSGRVAFLGRVVCLKRRLRRHTVLRAEDLALVHRDLGQAGANPLTELAPAVGRRLTVNLPAGAVLTEAVLEPPPLVRRDDLVTIVVRGPGVVATAPGRVRRAGARGELVPVKNLTSRKVIHARVKDATTVEVIL